MSFGKAAFGTVKFGAAPTAAAPPPAGGFFARYYYERREVNMFKNVASQKIRVFAFNNTTGVEKTGDAASLTCYVSKDFGAVTVLGDTTATEEDATNAKGWYLFDLTQAETNADSLNFTCKSSTANISVIGQVISTLPNRFTTLVIDAAGLADANTVKLGPTGAGTAQTARDVGASVLLSNGTGTGQLDFTSGVVKANLAQILGTALTETAGLLAGGFKQFFNIASPTSTMNTITTVTTTTTATNLTTNNDKTGYGLSSAAVQAIWDALTSALTTVGSIGKKLSDWVIGTTQTGDAYAVVNDATFGNSKLVRATTPANTLDVSATGEAGLDFNNIKDATVGHTLTNITVPLVTTTTTATNLTTNNDKTGYSLSAAAVTAIWAVIIEGTHTAIGYMRIFASALAGILAGAATTTITTKDIDNTKTRITATVDANGNRTALTLDET